MNLINSWTSKNKKWDKVAIKIRLGRITLFDLYIDFTRKQAGLIIMNIGFKTNNKNEKNIKPVNTR